MSGDINLSEWYTHAQALARLEANAGRKLHESTPRQIARKGKVKTYALSANATLYYKPEIDAYIVEERGQKAARSQRQRALGKKPTRKPASKKKDGEQEPLAMVG